MTPVLQLILVPVLIAVNAFFVAAEYAVVATRPMHLDLLRRTGHRAAADAMAVLRRHAADSIGTVQICITMTNLILGWLGEPAMTRVLHALLGGLADAIPPAVLTPMSIVLAFLLVTLLTVVFSELLPKALTLRHVTWAARYTALPVLAIARVVRPLVWVMNQLANVVTVPLGLGRVDTHDQQRVTTAEIRLLTKAAAEEGELTPRERSVILNALTLADRPVSQVMVPRVRVKHLDMKWTMQENRAAINERLYSRLPLCDGGMDRVIGIVHTKEFLSAYNAAGDVTVLLLIAREPVYVPQTQTIDQLLAMFTQTHSQMMIVLDEYGGAAGVVTLRDTIDNLLGAGDATSLYPPKTLEVSGDTPLYDLARSLHRHDWCASETIATVGGLVLDRLGHFPVAGEAVEVDGVRLHVIAVDGRNTLRIRAIPTHAT
ncbi:MAG: HlyC/CorC family transporter [Phycisphaeraceae bacterium]|nr:HlyC/CorC family transporter [Phycisphaeraceae bacterium]